MGLSTWERHHKLVWAIRRLTQLGRQINSKELSKNLGSDFSDESFLKIKLLCGKLWATFFADSGNSAFWLMGSNEEVKSDGETIWEIALSDNIKGCSKPESEFNDSDKMNKKIEERKREFDAFDGFLDIEGLLTGNNKPIYEIYKWCQQAQYAINRYRGDEFAVKYKPVLDKIHTILGEIFNIFHLEREFSEVYLLNKICKKLYTEKYSWAGKKKYDEVTKFLVDHCSHHYLSSAFKDMYGYRIHHLKKAYKSLLDDDSMQNRAYWAVKLTAKKFSIVNDHDAKKKDRSLQREALIQLIDKKKWDKEKFMKAFKEADDQKKKDVEEKTKEYKKENDFYERDLLED